MDRKTPRLLIYTLNGYYFNFLAHAKTLSSLRQFQYFKYFAHFVALREKVIPDSRGIAGINRLQYTSPPSLKRFPSTIIAVFSRRFPFCNTDFNYQCMAMSK
jgi:hypothetical protein